MSMSPAGVEAPQAPQAPSAGPPGFGTAVAAPAPVETYPGAPAGTVPFGTAPPTMETPAASQAELAVVQPDPRPLAYAPRAASVTAEEFIREAMAIIDAARPMPLSTSVMINRDELMMLLESALAAVPDETRQARWLLREREEVLAQARLDANMVIDEARSRVAQMVSRTEVSRMAERRAQQLLHDAQVLTSRRRYEVDEYCERKLAQFASAIDQIQVAVQAARRKIGKRALSPVVPAAPAVQPGQPQASQPQASQPQPSQPYPGPYQGGAATADGPPTQPSVFDQDQM